MSIIPALGRLMQKDRKLEASLVYIVRPCLKNPKAEREEKREERGGKRCSSVVE
jgi:hypothetical protein